MVKMEHLQRGIGYYFLVLFFYLCPPIERDLEELKEFRGVGADTPQYVFSQYKQKSIGINF